VFTAIPSARKNNRERFRIEFYLFTIVTSWKEHGYICYIFHTYIIWYLHNRRPTDPTPRLICPNPPMPPVYAISKRHAPKSHAKSNPPFSNLTNYHIFFVCTTHLSSSQRANFTVGVSTARQNRSATDSMIGR